MLVRALRFIEYLAFAFFIVGCIYIVSVVLMVLGVIFGGFSPIHVDFGLIKGGAVVVFAGLLIALGLVILIHYIPSIVVEGEEA